MKRREALKQTQTQSEMRKTSFFFSLVTEKGGWKPECSGCQSLQCKLQMAVKLAKYLNLTKMLNTCCSFVFVNQSEDAEPTSGSEGRPCPAVEPWL